MLAKYLTKILAHRQQQILD